MKHILLNPHNGSNVDYEGVKLAPGESLHVRKHVAEALIARFPFLLLQPIEGNDKDVEKAKPGKIKGRLEWRHENTGTDELPAADSVHHVVTQSAKKSAAKKKAKAKK